MKSSRDFSKNYSKDSRNAISLFGILPVESLKELPDDFERKKPEKFIEQFYNEPLKEFLQEKPLKETSKQEN